MKTPLKIRRFLLTFGLIASTLFTVGTIRAQALVLNAGPQTIGKYDATTGAAIDAGLVGATTGDSQKLAVDNAGAFYETFYNEGTVRKYDSATGALLNGTLVSGLIKPAGIAYDSLSNSLFVGSFTTGVISQYDATTGATINASLISGFGVNQLNMIRISGGNLYVSLATGVGVYTTAGVAVNATLITGMVSQDTAFSGTSLFLTTGNIVGEYNATTGAAVNASLITGLNNAFALGINGSGNLAVVEFSGNRAKEYNVDGTLVEENWITGLASPLDIAFLPVPEPSTYALLGLGLGVASFLSRKRARKPASSEI